MAFPREAKRIPASIGRIEVRFATMSAADTSVDATSAAFIEVLDELGAPIAVRSFSILEHATTTQKAALYNFLKNIRTKAQAEILPESPSP